MAETLCHCQSGLLFTDCCGPILAGSSSAATAEALMRSRYSANVLKNTGYLLNTWHPTKRPPSINPENIPTWCGLSILASEQGQSGDDHGIVEFRALYKSDNGLRVLHERSSFAFENGSWLYFDGELVETGSLLTGKIGRNDLCPCGSGKKSKKCCLNNL